MALAPSVLRSFSRTRHLTKSALRAVSVAAKRCKSQDTSLSLSRSVSSTSTRRRASDVKFAFVEKFPFIEEMVRDDERRMLNVRWENDHEVIQYPYVYLRDNCQCSSCFNDEAKCRTFLLKDLDVKVKPVDIGVDIYEGTLNITWTDGHDSVYRLDWLYSRYKGRNEQEHLIRKPVQLWGSTDNTHSATFDEIMNDDDVLCDWISRMEERGIFLIRDAPQEPGQVEKIGKRVAFLKETNYGKTNKVTSKANPTTIAYTPTTVALHTDFAYYQNVPELGMFHCIANVPHGGDSEFVDGFQVATQMREEHPEEFRILSTTPLTFFDIGEDNYKFFKMGKHTTIGLNNTGDIVQVNFSNHSRCSYLTMPPEQMERLYLALQKFNDMCYQDRNILRTKLSPGDIMCFDNLRVLHGRTGYSIKPGEVRILEAAFMDWDILHSRRRNIEVANGTAY